MIERRKPGNSILASLLRERRFSDESCPSVNGFRPEEISADDVDAPIITRFLLACAQFNRAQAEFLRLSAQDAARKRGPKKLADARAEMRELDDFYHAEGIVAEPVLTADGLIEDIRYTSPREHWNYHMRRAFTAVIDLEDLV